MWEGMVKAISASIELHKRVCVVMCMLWWVRYKGKVMIQIYTI